MKLEIISLAETLKESGFVVYLAENQNYGIFTDRTGKRVVYFQYDRLGGYQFSGTYKASRECGTGWQLGINYMDKSDLENALITPAPRWATNGCPVNYHSINTYLKDMKRLRKQWHI